MRLVIFLIIINAANLSCSNNGKDLLLEYASVNCSIKGKSAERDSVSQILSVTGAHPAAVKSEASQKVGGYAYEINDLANKIYQVESEYEQKYNELSQKHEAKHGHMMTPQYEQNIKKL